MFAGSLAPDSAQQAVMASGFTPSALMKYNAAAYVIAEGDEVSFNDTLLMEFASFEYTGAIQGTVTDENAGGLPLDGVLVTAFSGAAAFSDTTSGGGYSFSGIPTGSYTVTASKSGYFDSTAAGISVTVGSTSDVNFSLGYPAVDLSPADSVGVVLSPGEADSSHYLTLDIGGTRELQYTVEWPEKTSGSKTLADSLWGLDLSAATGDNLCLGVEFDGVNIWVSGAASDPATDPNYLYKFSSSGALSDSFPQPSGNGWGWRDLCFDGSFLYVASGDSIEQIDTMNGSSTGLMIPAYCSPCRGLAYDPASDLFYTANYDSDIFRVRRNGSLDTSWSNSKHIFGLAWDATAPDGPWLWVFSQDGTPQIQAAQFDPRTGTYTGIGFQCPAVDPANACAGGACFTTELVPGRGVLLGLLQDANDRLVAYDIRPENAPWLSLSRVSGAAMPPFQDSLRLTFNSAGLDSSLTYRARITVLDQEENIRDTLTAVLRFPTGVEGRGPENRPPGPVLSLKSKPNPFSSSARFRFQLDNPGKARLDVYNISGQLVRALIPEQRFEAGEYHAVWDGLGNGRQRLPSGIYLLRLQTGSGNLIQKAIKLR
jgi:hypothetical protein